MASQPPSGQKPKVQPCRYKTGKTLGAGSYSVVKECVHIDTGRYYAAKVINKRLMSGREHMVGEPHLRSEWYFDGCFYYIGSE
jgi:calcium/calmodulin-dependent protein kinase I